MRILVQAQSMNKVKRIKKKAVDDQEEKAKVYPLPSVRRKEEKQGAKIYGPIIRGPDAP